MILKHNFLKFSAMALVASIVGMSSCKDEDDPFTLQDTAAITDESVTDSYFQDMDDMAGIALSAPSDTQYSSGRISGSLTIEDHRFKCAGAIVTLSSDPTSTPEIPKGIITVDFGTSGCADLKGNVRKGKMIFSYYNKRFMPGAKVVTTTENYFINDIKLEGTRTLTNVQNSTTSAPRFNVVLVNGKATFSDQLMATRESNITWQWNRAVNPSEDNLEVEMTSTASGTTRQGKNYTVAILKNLVYKRHCGISVQGIKKYTIDGTKEITIDFGDGTCDKSMTVTVNGVTRVITLK